MSSMDVNPPMEVIGAEFAGSPILADVLLTSDLPLVVWLRGDELHANEFTLSADEVMTKLGIKRSRLTQISGHDLRVGRMRVDRYVRPVYRPQDIQEYMSWTRATATHQKSSDLILKAATELKGQTDQLREEAIAVMNESVAGLGQSLKDAIFDSQKNLTAHLALLDDRMSRMELTQLSVVQQNDSALAAITANTAPIEPRLHALANQSEQQSIVIADTQRVSNSIAMAVLTSQTEAQATKADVNKAIGGIAEIHVLGERQQAALGEVARVLGMLLTHYRELTGRLDQQSQALANLTKSMETELPKGQTQDERYRTYLAMRRGYGLTKPLSRKS